MLDPEPDITPFEALFSSQLDLENEIFPNEITNEEHNDHNDDIDGQSAQQCNATQHKLLLDYVQQAANNEALTVEDHFKDLQWVNVTRSISLSDDLKGKLVLCDFFTYCCINCLHVLPFLQEFEQQYHTEPMVVLGVHSPKFDNERSLQNVADAVFRHKINHPVCNDPQLKLWRLLSIHCWPSIAIIGPNSRLLFLLVGERAIQTRLKLYVDTCLQYFGQHQLLSSEKDLLPLCSYQKFYANELLYYPTKVAFAPSHTKFAIANTRKHSIIVVNLDGIVLHVVGSNLLDEKGFRDGALDYCLFNYPQGIAWQTEDLFFVCDTENHAIRKVDLQANMVQTVVGNGQMGNDISGGKIGAEQTLNSPWDLVYDFTRQRLYIAMAGSHQVWVLILSEPGDMVHGMEVPFGSCLCFAGDGHEQKRNNRFPLKASFAQPSGIALNDDKLYIADSESSSIRMIELASGAVSTLVGGAVDPQDLFAFGDQDGVGLKCRLQHCMGVCVDAEQSILYIADTFNHKIKQVHIKSKACHTLEFDWSDDSCPNKMLNEPNDLCLYTVDSGDKNDKYLLLCDTNNHRLVSVNLNTGKICQFGIRLISPTIQLDVVDSPPTDLFDFHKVANEKHLLFGQTLRIMLTFRFVNELKANKQAKHRIRVNTDSDTAGKVQFSPSTSFLVDQLDQVHVEATVHDNTTEQQQQVSMSITFRLECQLNLCHCKANYCVSKRVCIEQPVCWMLPTTTTTANELAQSSQNQSVVNTDIEVII